MKEKKLISQKGKEGLYLDFFHLKNFVREPRKRIVERPCFSNLKELFHILFLRNIQQKISV